MIKKYEYRVSLMYEAKDGERLTAHQQYLLRGWVVSAMETAQNEADSVDEFPQQLMNYYPTAVIDEVHSPHLSRDAGSADYAELRGSVRMNELLNVVAERALEVIQGREGLMPADTSDPLYGLRDALRDAGPFDRGLSANDLVDDPHVIGHGGPQ